MTHDAIFYEVLLVCGPQLLLSLIFGSIFWYQHRLMWSDYKKKHGINGDPEGAG
jgi:hypothetical protein